MSKTSGFTLIELLIVMAILTLLAGILFTVFAGAREKARQTHCMNNLKQLGAAILLYKQDYDGGWPPDLGTIYPQYASDAALFVCPNAVATRAERDAAIHNGGIFISYERYGGSFLPTLSGELFRRTALSPQIDCENRALRYAEAAIADRLPVLRCVDHIFPGMNCMSSTFGQRTVDEEVHAVIPTLEQDGRVVFKYVPNGYGPPLAFNSAAEMTTKEWLRLLGAWKEKLGCD